MMRGLAASGSRWLVVPMLCAAIACGGAPPPADPKTPEPIVTGSPAPSPFTFPADLITQADLTTILQAADTLEPTIPRETFDFTAVVRRAGLSPASLAEWVRTNTFWVPYRGALRGPAGVLMDRLGNSLDRALLLAELLRSASHRVELARATLPAARAQTLLKNLPPAPADPLPRPATPTPEQSAAELKRLADLAGLDPARMAADAQTAIAKSDALLAELRARVAEQPPYLSRILGERPAAKVDDREVIEALADHWWVRVQTGSGWTDLDVVAPNLPRPAAQQTFPYDKPFPGVPLPDEFVQTVAIRVIAEQWSAGQVSERTVLAQTLRPAELVGQPVELRQAAGSWPELPELMKASDRSAAIVDAASKQTEWLPTLMIGGRPVRQLGIKANGELREPPARLAFSSRRPNSEQVSGADAVADGEFTAEWIEFEVSVPGQPRRIERRDVFDLFNQQPRSGTLSRPVVDDRRRAERGLAMLSEIQILLQGARPSLDYVRWQFLEQVRDNRPAYANLITAIASGDLARIAEVADRGTRHNTALVQLSFWRFELSPVRNQVYLAAPNILANRYAFALDSTGGPILRRGFDIVMNGVGATAAAQDPFLTRVTQGIADTNVEALLHSEMPQGNAGALLRATGTHDGAWTLLRTPAEAVERAPAWPADIGARIGQAIAAGDVVVAPVRLPAQSSQAWAWWRIDPVTGDSLGMGAQGWGQTLTEYLLIGGVFYVMAFKPLCIVASGRFQNTRGAVVHCLNLMILGPPAYFLEFYLLSATAPPPPGAVK